MKTGDGKKWGCSRCILGMEVTGIADGLRVRGAVREEPRTSPWFLPQIRGWMMVSFSLKGTIGRG